MSRRLGFISIAIALAIAATPATAGAQTNIEVNAGVQFDYVNPGARSLALAAFTAIADDATAAFTNPAGLRALSKMEISFEGRFRRFETPYTLKGHGFGNPTGIGTDTVPGLVDGFSRDNVASPSFFSFVYPTSKWALAAYGHEVARFQNAITTEGAYVGNGADLRRLFPLQGSIDLRVRDYGVSGSYNVSPQVSIGGGVVFYDFSNAAETQRFDVLGFEVPNYAPSNLRSVQVQEGDDKGIGVNVGVMLQPTSKLQIGAVYRRGAEFALELTNTVRGNVVSVDEATSHVPDAFSAGVVFRVSDPLRVAVDVVQIQYSQLLDDFVDVVQPGIPTLQYRVDDATEIHAGAEYLFVNLKAPIALRGGVWYDPAHALTYIGDQFDLQAIYNVRDEGQIHYTFGGGVLVGNFELHAGADMAKTVKTTSISLVARF
jgi:long-chain fatty acid transport protein